MTLDMLDSLLSDGIIDEVLGRLKSGKEADVYRVVYRGEVIAAKVYKDRLHRSFQHNSAYTEGRRVRNSRTQRAMDRGSRFGQDEAEEAWKTAESQALHKLHNQGVRVPVPVMFYDGVLLMQLVTDAEGFPAPRLIDAEIPQADASAMYLDLRGQIVGMLCCDLIHGDLSPYNVLLGSDGPTIIDFPQMISAAHNSRSETFFRRDCDNILQFFVALDRSLARHRGDARQIWAAYVRRELTPDFVPAAVTFDDRRPPWPGPSTPRTAAPQAPRPQQVQRPGPAQSPRQGPSAPPRQGPPFAQRQGPPRESVAEPHRPAGRDRAAQAPFSPHRRAQPPVVVYLKRTGTREPHPATEPEATRPKQVQPAVPPTGPSAPEGAVGGGRRRRRR